MPSTFKVLRVRRTNLFDVFKDDGWTEWTRVHWHPNSNLTIMGGNVLKPFELKIINFIIYKLVTGKKK